MALMEHGSTSSPQAASESGLRRELGLFDATMLIMGDMIGIGIFVTTGDIAQSFPSPGGILLIWLLSGLLALPRALFCAQLAAGMPLSGGGYYYFPGAYGPVVGLLSGSCS